MHFIQFPRESKWNKIIIINVVIVDYKWKSFGFKVASFTPFKNIFTSSEVRYGKVNLYWELIQRNPDQYRILIRNKMKWTKIEMSTLSSKIML